MNEGLVVSVVLLLITSIYGFRVAYKYYKLNKITYSNSKNALLALGEYDKGFAFYMESKYKNMDAVTDPEQILFESIIASVLKYKSKIVNILKNEKKGNMQYLGKPDEKDNI